MRGLRSPRRGIAMVLAILVLAILVVVVLQLVFTTRVEEALARNARDEGEAEKAEDAAVELARVLLASDDEDEPDTPESPWAVARQGIELANATVDIEIVDEARKLNLRLLTSKSERVRQWAEGALERLVAAARGREEEGVEEPDPELLVERIVAWARKGETGNRTRPGGGRGGEEGAALRLVTIAELLFLEDFERFIVFGKRGTAAEEEEKREEAEEQDDWDEVEEEEEEENLPLAEVLTVWGDGRVNINTACAEVLMALHGGIDEEVAERIIAHREEEPGADGEADPNEPPPPPPPPADPDAAGEEEPDPTAEKWFQTVAELRTVEGLVQQEKSVDVLRDLLAVAGKTPKTGKDQTEDYRDAPLCVRSRFFKAHVTVRCGKARRQITVILFRTDEGGVQVLRKGEGVQ